MKFSDLFNVFELFIFSDIFEDNRNILIEGQSLMLTLIKNYSDENKSQKRVNVKKIISLKDIIDKPINDIKLKFKTFKEFDKLTKLTKNGETKITIHVDKEDETFIFRLNEGRKLDNKLINSLNLVDNLLKE